MIIKYAVKFCGGCKPTYDRVAALKAIEGVLKETLCVADSKNKYEKVFVICGCSARCAGINEIKADFKEIIDSRKSADTALNGLKKQENVQLL